jgi:hypothetical protein
MESVLPTCCRLAETAMPTDTVFGLASATAPKIAPGRAAGEPKVVRTNEPSEGSLVVTSPATATTRHNTKNARTPPTKRHTTLPAILRPTVEVLLMLPSLINGFTITRGFPGRLEALIPISGQAEFRQTEG